MSASSSMLSEVATEAGEGTGQRDMGENTPYQSHDWAGAATPSQRGARFSSGDQGRLPSRLSAWASRWERVQRWVVGWRFRLFQRHRHERVTVEHVGGVPIIVLPGVLNPVLFRSGEYLARELDATLIPFGSSVLDMGTGSGIGAIFAARLSESVVAVDINPKAVRCARLNVILHQREAQISVREGDLFAPVAGEQFDVVLFNPPYFVGEPTSDFDRALRATTIAERFAEGLARHLQPEGHALLLLSSMGEQAAFLEALHSQGMAHTLIHQKSFSYETLYLYRADFRC